MSEIGENICRRRKELGMTQEDLALLLGYKSKSSINKIELGVSDLPQKKIVQFAEALRTTPAYLMGWLDDEETKENDDLVTVIEKLENDSDLLRAALTLVNLPEPQRGAMVQMLLSLGAK